MSQPSARLYDVIIRQGTLYDGSGDAPFVGDVALDKDTIVGIGALGSAEGRLEIDAAGLAVSPGFINMLSWANTALLADGRSQSDIRQGVTLEVMGESFSEGPLTDAMKREKTEAQGDIRFDVTWSTLDEYLRQLVGRGVSTNVASFVGSGTVRTHVLGYDDRPATPSELERMRALVRQALEEGAVGLASALVYVPDCFSRGEELLALARVVAEHGGLYISHMRSEGDRLLEGLEELLGVARQSGARAEIYHLKAAGRANWHKLDEVIRRVEAAQAEGLAITADMYPYAAGASGLDAAMPPWVQEGGHRAWLARLRDPALRARVIREIAAPVGDWESQYLLAGGAEGALLLAFKNPALKALTGKTLAEAAAMRGTSPEETIIDLVVEDDSRVGTAYFMASEENLRRELALPWVSLGSDAASLAPEGVFLKSSVHPRAYGTFARFLAKFVREEGLVPLQEAIRRLTSLPARNLALERRGALRPGYLADLVVFDPLTIQDRATYAQPQQYATGVRHVFVNGIQVLRDGEHTGALPGRVVRGPGWRG